MFLPSETGVGEAGLLRVSSGSFRSRGASRRHRISPLERSREKVSRRSPWYAVRKIRPPARIGDEWPAGNATLQIRFFSGPNSVGRLLVSLTPAPFGPRKRGQSVAEPDTVSAITARKTCKLFFIISRQEHDAVTPTIQDRIDTKSPRTVLDAWTREVVQWHFDPETGTPFWLERAKTLDFDPRREIQTYDDLDRLGLFQDEWLRGGPVRRWVPKAYAGKPICTFETGGSTGVPKSRINYQDFRIDYEQFSNTLPDEFFPRGADWIMVGPSGPRRLRLAVEHLAQVRGGICFGLDLDPRWVIKLLKRGDVQQAELYKQHVVEQALTLLKAHEIKCMFATPKLLEAICERINLKKAGITGVFCGGTEMTPQFHRFAKEELLDGIYFAPTYGNTLMGLATHKPFDPADNYAVIYYPPNPRAMIEVVDPDEPARGLGG